MLSFRMRRFLRVQRIAMAVAGFCFGLLASVFASRLQENWSKWLPLVAMVAVVSGLIGLVSLLRQRVGIDVAIRAPLTIRSQQERTRYARRGFVGFVPLYTPKYGTPSAALSPEERLKAAGQLDFNKLRVEESNLQPTIEALVSHRRRLEHCWLLATSGAQAPGSLPYARLLAEYLRQKKGLTCEFHYGEDYTISLDDDALVLSKTYDYVRKAFKEAADVGIPPKEMVADITTGFRSMTLGMVLSCLDGEQDIEFVGTRYDQSGRPRGDLFPIIFDFEPKQS